MLASWGGVQVGTGGSRVELGLLMSPSPTRVRSHSPSPSCPGGPCARWIGERGRASGSVSSPASGLCPLEVTDGGWTELWTYFWEVGVEQDGGALGSGFRRRKSGSTKSSFLSRPLWSSARLLWARLSSSKNSASKNKQKKKQRKHKWIKKNQQWEN